MYNSQYYTCEEIDQRLLQNYLDDYNSQNNTSLTKAQFLQALYNMFNNGLTLGNIVQMVGSSTDKVMSQAVVTELIEAVANAINEGSLYLGILPPSVNPGNHTTNVFALVKEVGTYTYFKDQNDQPIVISNEGVYVFNYNVGGNYWISTPLFQIDTKPTPNSTFLVRSGSILNSIIKDGSAFDLSAYNNGTTYSSLFDALIALNALPDVYKQGGMSIKYVQSSDNKYVQYRLMSDTFNTTPANWQGVDDEPTAGSNNLVKSGGVWDELRKRDVYIDGKVDITNDILLKYGYIDTDGSIKSAETWKYGVVKLFEGETITVNNTGIEDYPSLGLASSSNPSNVEVLPGKTYTAVADCLVVVSAAKKLNSLVISTANSFISKNSDEIPTAGSGKFASSDGIFRNGANFHFVGNGDTYVSAEWGKAIAGHTYRIYPLLTEWDFGTTISGAYIFEVLYTKSDGTTASLTRGIYATRPLRKFYDVTIPSDVKDNSGFTIGGRAAAGLKIWFAIYDITDLRNSINELYMDRNYTEGKNIDSSGNIVDDTDSIIAKINVQNGDKITWVYNDDQSKVFRLQCFNSADEKIDTPYSSSEGRNGSRYFVLNVANTAYVIASFANKVGFTPRLLVNNVEVWHKTGGDINVLDTKVKALEEDVSGLEGDVKQLMEEAFAHGNTLMNKALYVSGTSYPRGTVIDKEDWNLSEIFVPVTPGQEITYVIGGSSNSNVGLHFYNSDKSLSSGNWWGANNKSTADSRKITVPAGVSYLKACWYKELTNGDPNLHPILINGVAAFTVEEYAEGHIDDIDERLSAVETIVSPTDTEHGIIGEKYPEQMYDIFTLLNAGLHTSATANRLHFIHVSDNHNGSFGYADEFLDYCPAKFLINTGDLVADKFSDGMANTIAKATASEKPVYLTLGNHDYSRAPSHADVFNAFFGDDETEGSVNYHNVQAGGVATDKTYYSFDFAAEKVRCIVLDMNDGWSDAELPDLSPTYMNQGVPGATYGNMSQEQIEWFVAKLQEAKTNSYHVCVFIHTLPSSANEGTWIDDFCDYRGVWRSVNSALTFLPQIIDAFIDGTSFSFTYRDHTYSGSFSGAGHFVAWFCGHTHYDIAGWMDEHPNQFMINVCRPYAETYEAHMSSYDGDRLGVHWNYVTVDTFLKSLSVYRVGQQDTIHATKRKSFRIIYK